MNSENANNNVNNQMVGNTLGSVTPGVNPPQPSGVEPLQAQVPPVTEAQPVQPTPVTPQPSAPVQPTPVQAQPSAPVQPQPMPNDNAYVAAGGQSETPNVAPNPSAINPGVVNQGNVNPTPAGPVNPNTNNGPVAQPIPGTNVNAGLAEPMAGTPLNVDNNINTNSFVSPEKAQTIGANPPSEEPKKKKGMNKGLFIILILVLIAGIAYGLYYFLSVSSKITVSLKEVTLGLGEVVSDDISTYATIKNDKNNICSVDTSDINSEELGEYTYTITCGEENYTGKAIVSDVTAPEVIAQPVFKAVNESIDVSEFVTECNDPSDCNLEFVDENTVNSYLATIGSYKVEIKATDNANNVGTYETKLYVTAYKPFVYTTCSSTEELLNDYQATKTISDVFPISNATDIDGVVFLGIGIRNYKYVFETTDAYLAAIAEKTNEITFDNITGTATYDDANNTLIISTDLSQDILNSENSGTFPTFLADIQSLYTNGKGYACSNSQTYSIDR